MELSARKKQILKRVIEDYIASAEPVGSKAIAQEMGGAFPPPPCAMSLPSCPIWATSSSRTPPPAACRPPRATGCMSTS